MIQKLVPQEELLKTEFSKLSGLGMALYCLHVALFRNIFSSLVLRSTHNPFDKSTTVTKHSEMMTLNKSILC